MVRIDMAFPPQQSFMFQSIPHHEDHEHNPLNPSSNSPNTTLNPSYPQHHFNGGHTSFMVKRSVSFSGVDHHNDNQYLQCHEDQVHGGLGEDELSDDGLPLGEKKKRLSLEQVKTLEKSFELGNKLEPERKIQLAKALGLQPRQIAIWFQNRRARWKTKQLEKDYDVLKKQFDALKADNDALHSQNNQLLAQLSALKAGRDPNEAGIRNLKKDGDEGCWSNGSDNSSEINIEFSRTPASMNSPASSHEINGKKLFASTHLGSSSITQLLEAGSTRSDLQCLKVDHQQINVQDGSFVCNMFNGIEEQQGFWAWPDQQHHFH